MRMRLLQEAVAKLESQVAQLKEQMAKMEASLIGQPSKLETSGAKPVDESKPTEPSGTRRLNRSASAIQ